MIELSIVIPCLNEEYTIKSCIDKCFYLLRKHHIEGEVIVVDNGSSDASVNIINGTSARLVHASEKGYGYALRTGIEAANGLYVLMGDGDNTYNFTEAYPFLKLLREGNQLVMGNRFGGQIMKNAMPFTHRYIGNPILSFIARFLFHIDGFHDFHCGMRAFHRKSILDLDLNTNGMEFASELAIKACLANYRTAEVPVNLYQCDQRRKSKLRTLRDGFRHLIYMMKLKFEITNRKKSYYENGEI